MPAQAQMSMFHSAPEEKVTWTAPASLPVLSSQHRRVWVDEETTGLNPYTDTPVGISCFTEDRQKFYLPFGHAGGGNLDKNLVLNWVRRELAGKDLYWINAKYGVHVWKNVGVDFEAMGCRPHDVAFQAALLDERRRRFNLNQLDQDVLGRFKSKDVKEPDKDRIAELPAGLVGPYAEQDAEDVHDLDQAMRYGTNSLLSNTIEGDNLNQVLDLEDSIIYAVARMERKGALIDRPKLEKWVAEAKARYEKLILEIYQKVKFRVNPDSPDDMSKLFKYLGLSCPQTEAGNDSFPDSFLKTVPNEIVQECRKARKTSSVLSKYLTKYLKALDSENILRYSLHQLRATEEGYGTVSGRFSSAAPGSIPGANVQQVPRVKKQMKELGPDWIIRELFIPAAGKVWSCFDAAQIEFRLFAHYAGSQKLYDAYAKNPWIDFHDLVCDMIKKIIPDFERDPAKTVNFAKVYGAGRPKIAIQLDLPQSESDVFVDAYDEEFPEVDRLLTQASKLATNRGYVKTFDGRRARFTKPRSKDPEVRRLEEIAFKPHSALNRVLQGTAAGVMKKKLKEVDDNRKLLALDLRFPVHDELDGDQDPDPKYCKLEAELLNEQSFKFKVPILWEGGTGANWREAKG